MDHVPLLSGRTALQCYEDFMLSFVNKFESFIGTVIEEISIGLGPSGELRYCMVLMLFFSFFFLVQSMKLLLKHDYEVIA